MVNAIKDAQLSLYFHLNEIIKWSGSSFLSPALSQKHVKMFVYGTQVFYQISFGSS